MLKYPCLVLDHDDTAVDSTHSVNYPQFREALSVFRPQLQISEEEFAEYCYDPGFFSMCSSILRYTQEELDAHTQMWKEYHKTHFSGFYDGIPELMARQRALGGLICVVSHSSTEVILAEYRHHRLPEPDLIFSADLPAHQRKPNPWPLQQIMAQYHLRPHELLVVDDMPHGGHMAHAAGAEFACAGWCRTAHAFAARIRSSCDYYFSSVQALSRFLFEER